MSGLKVDDAVMIKAVVVKAACRRAGEVLVSLGPGRFTELVDTKQCILIDPDELKVGDPVTRKDSDHDWTIEHIKVHISFGSTAGLVRPIQNGMGQQHVLGIPLRELTKLPPKPIHTIAIVGTEVQLLHDGKKIRSMNVWMATSPSEIIERWFRDFDIDMTINEAFELIITRSHLDQYEVMDGVFFVAIRHAKGWQVKCGSRIQPEVLAKVCFPRIDGPYLTEEQ